MAHATGILPIAKCELIVYAHLVVTSKYLQCDLTGLLPLCYEGETCFSLADRMRLCFPRNMVGTSVLRKLRMRKRRTNRAVPLDVVPERRTKRCSPRFRPGDRFCKLSFRYLSPGIEGEKCRPLDHMWQIPFFPLTRIISSNSFYIYSTTF